MSLGLADLRVGHWTDPNGHTGCTVVLPPPGNVSSVSVRGGGSGTRETALLHPAGHVAEVSAFLLTGGSAFGLGAADGVVRWCEEQGVGYARYGGPIPIVPAAVLFDLRIGSWSVRPTAESGYAACRAAETGAPAIGSVGAGTGATVGKLGGLELAMRGGLGHATVTVGEVVVGALAAVNASGDVIDEHGGVIAGTRYPGGAAAAIGDRLLGKLGRPLPDPVTSTTLAVVTTNARLDKGEVHRVAVQAHDGMARAVRPAHTAFDGDTVFATATGRVAAPVDLIAFLAEEALAGAIRAGVLAATPLPDLPAAGGHDQG